jgi:hypothetical protein
MVSARRLMSSDPWTLARRSAEFSRYAGLGVLRVARAGSSSGCGGPGSGMGKLYSTALPSELYRLVKSKAWTVVPKTGPGVCTIPPTSNDRLAHEAGVAVSLTTCAAVMSFLPWR